MLKRYACTRAELSCIIGNLFIELSPPCERCGEDALTITGTTVTGNKGTLFITAAGFDFFLIHEDKAYLQYCRAEIEKHVAALGLSLNNKTNIYPLRNGIDFLGFHTYLTETGAVIRKVRRRSKNNMKRKLKKMRGLVERGKITTATVEQSYKSWRGHASKGNCYHLIRRTDHYYDSLFKSKEAGKCQKQ